MFRLRLLFLAFITLLLMVLNLFFGAVHIPAEDVIEILIGGSIENEAFSFIVIESRLPQCITALLAGASLAVSGLMLQTLFRNPLAGPSILGITSGASLGVAVIILFFSGVLSMGYELISGELAVIFGALAGSFVLMGILIILSRRIKSNLSLLIVGIMAGYLTSSLVSLLTSVSNANNIQNYVMWGLGNFSGVSLQRLPLFSSFCILGLIISFFMAKPLNLLLLGDNYAINLGVNIKKARFWLLVSTGLLSAIVTAFCGPIGFIGLAMPHIARLLMKSDNHWILLPATMLSGGSLALICNLLSVLPEGNVIPINALTPIAGVPVVLYVILRGRKEI